MVPLLPVGLPRPWCREGEQVEPSKIHDRGDRADGGDQSMVPRLLQGVGIPPGQRLIISPVWGDFCRAG